MHGVLAQRMFAVQIFSPDGVQQAGAVHRFGDRRARQFQQRGHDVPQFSQVRANRAALSDVTLRPGDKQWYMDTALERLCLLEHQMVAQHFTVIGDKQNHGVIHNLFFHQRGNQASDLMIHMGDGSIIARPQLLNIAFIRGCCLGMVTVTVALPADAVVPVTAPRFSQRLILVQIQIIFWGIQRRMRPHEAGH